MKKFITALTNNTSLYIYGIFFVFILWFLISLAVGTDSIVFPTPIDTLGKTGELIADFKHFYLYKCIAWTLIRALLGFGISFISALVIGLIAGSFKKLQTFLKPIIIVLKSAPTAAFVYLFLILCKDNRFAPVFIVVLLAFPILYESVVGGMNAINDDIKDALKVDATGFLRPLLKVKLPLSFNYILVGVASSFGLSLKTTVMAEIIAGESNYGLGSAITSFRSEDVTNLTPVFAVTLITILIIIIVDLLSYFIKKKVSLNI